MPLHMFMCTQLIISSVARFQYWSQCYMNFPHSMLFNLFAKFVECGSTQAASRSDLCIVRCKVGNKKKCEFKFPRCARWRKQLCGNANFGATNAPMPIEPLNWPCGNSPSVPGRIEATKSLECAALLLIALKVFSEHKQLRWPISSAMANVTKVSIPFKQHASAIQTLWASQNRFLLYTQLYASITARDAHSTERHHQNTENGFSGAQLRGIDARSLSTNSWGKRNQKKKKSSLLFTLEQKSD